MKKLFVVLLCCIGLCGCGSVSSGYVDSSIDDTLQELDATQGDLHEISNNDKEHAQENEMNTQSQDIYMDKLAEIKTEVLEIAKPKNEILFNNIPWGSNYSSANTIMKDLDGFINMGMTNTPVSIDYMLGLSNKFIIECNDATNVGGMTWTILDGMNVAGYEVDECHLLFSSVLKDGHYILSEEYSSLYGAYYILKNTTDEVKMKEDLKSKISALYGEPDRIEQYEPFIDTGIMREYIYWYGTNDTIIILHNTTISYVWLGGEELLNTAIQSVISEQQSSENNIYGNGDTSGL